jgi:hypothetical protein
MGGFCPTGGIDKIQSFASLFAGNRLNIAVLSDYGEGDKKKVERLRQSEILKASQIFVVADFTGQSESDVEDLFSPDFYAELINQAYAIPAKDRFTGAKLAGAVSSPRIVKQVEACFRLLPKLKDFDHFTPAAFLIRHLELLDGEDDRVTISLDRFETVFKKLNEVV